MIIIIFLLSLFNSFKEGVIKLPPTSRGFARAGLFGLLVVNITKFSIKTKRDEETFTPALAKPLLN